MAKYMDLVKHNLEKCLLILVMTSLINIVAFILSLTHASSILISSFLAYVFSLYAISNFAGAKNGYRIYNMHIMRWLYLKKRNIEDEYQKTCFWHIAVMLPISALWTTVNLILAVITIVL